MSGGAPEPEAGEVVDVVARHHADHQVHALEAALGVVGLGQPVLEREAGDQREVPGAQRRERLDGQRGVEPAVAAGPGVLVEGLQLDARRGRRLAQAEAHHHLDVGEVGQHLGRRPLARRVRGLELPGVGSLDVVLEPCGRGLEHVDRVELPEERQVVRDGVGHARTVREVRGAGLPRAAPAAQPGTWG